MNWKCIFAHKWHGCKCERCGSSRNEQHDWDVCICKRCRKKRYVKHEQHDWGDDYKCKRCGIPCGFPHDLDGCTCKLCGATSHKWIEHTYDEFDGTSWNGREKYVARVYYLCSRCGAAKIENMPDGKTYIWENESALQPQ